MINPGLNTVYKVILPFIIIDLYRVILLPNFTLIKQKHCYRIKSNQNTGLKMTNTNYDLELTCTVSYKGQQIDFYFDPYNDCTDLEGLKEMALLELQNNEEIEVEANGIDENLIEIEITDFGNVPDKYAKENSIWEFAQAFAENEQEIEVIEAALECDINPSDIDEAFAGSYKDDEDFAYETAMSLGAIDKDARWPNNCIDWDKAASELMMDYCSSNGYYFRMF